MPAVLHLLETGGHAVVEAAQVEQTVARLRRLSSAPWST